MGKPAARIGDMHMCPMVTPGLPPIPHVGGPIIGPGVPTVLIGGQPAAVMGDMCTCVGPPDSIIIGSSGVMIGGKPAARMGDQCAHGGAINVGCPTVLIGESGSGSSSGGGAAAADAGAAAGAGNASQLPKLSASAQVQAAMKKNTAFATKAARIEALTQGAEEGADEVHKHNDNQCKVHYQLLSDDQEPVNGQKYEIRTSDGKIFKGTTGSDGKTQVITGYTEGMCEIFFLD